VDLFVVSLELLLEQAFELVRVEAAAHHEPQTIADEIHQVMVSHELGIALEHGAAIGRFEVGLDGHQAFLADLDEDLVQTLEQRNIVVAPVSRSLHEPDGAGEGGFGNLGGIARQKRAERGADNDEDFCGVPQSEHLAAFEHEAADHLPSNASKRNRTRPTRYLSR